MKTTTIIFNLLFVLSGLCPPACSNDSSNDNTEVQSTDSNSTDSSSDTDSMAPLSECGPLFGVPNEQTGLSPDQCQPSCDCDSDPFVPAEYTEAQIEVLATRQLLNPPELLTGNPYESPDDDPPTPDVVCGLQNDETEAGGYRLETFDTPEAATTAGAIITHYGACGLCSSLENLAVYMGIPDLTGPVRQCGIQGVTQGEEANMACLRDLGFNEACAQIWYYNTLNTRTLCLDICTAALSDPYHTPSGQINDCLQCDEDNSGPIFKAIAGRTRRNSGLPTAICRPCEGVAPVTHEYL